MIEVIRLRIKPKSYILSPTTHEGGGGGRREGGGGGRNRASERNASCNKSDKVYELVKPLEAFGAFCLQNNCETNIMIKSTSLLSTGRRLEQFSENLQKLYKEVYSNFFDMWYKNYLNFNETMR